MSVKDQLHDVVDRLDEDTAAAALAHLRTLARMAMLPIEPEDQRHGRGGALLTRGETFFGESTVDLARLAAQQGVEPVSNFADLLGDFWPEDETADEFIAAVRQWRREGGHA